MEPPVLFGGHAALVRFRVLPLEHAMLVPVAMSTFTTSCLVGTLFAIPIATSASVDDGGLAVEQVALVRAKAAIGVIPAVTADTVGSGRNTG